MPDARTLKSLPRLFFDQVEVHGTRKFIWNKIHNNWIGLTYNEVAQQIRDIASGLIARGINAGDRVVIISENRLEWVVADLAVMAIGAISVPAFTSNTENDHLHILEDSGAVAVICSTKRLASIAEGAAEKASECRLMIMVEKSQTIHQPAGLAIISWQQLMKDGHHYAIDLDHRINKIKKDDTACLIYTSGSDSQPKGVMLSHRSILHNIQSAEERFRGLDLGHETFLSLLPLSHAYEHTTGLYLPILLGSEIYHLTAPDQLAQTIKEVRPTMMTAVPRLCEILHDRIHQSINNSGGFAQRLAHMALKLGHARATNTRLPLLQTITDRMLDYTVRRKIQAHFGGRLKLMVSGGAALPPRVGRFFLALGLPLVQGYGQTEASPVISASPPDDIRITSVGPALPGVRVKLSDKGELLVRGDLVMQGYWNRPEDTAKVLQKGWLHTGDLAEMDADGYITIIGRSKDIIVNSGGENISPMRVEERLTSQPNIAQAMVDGDRRPWLAAVVVPSEACIARANGRRDKIISLIQNDIDTANTRLTTVERIRRFVLAEDGFTVENKRLTPTLKIRRHIIRREFRDQIDRLYDRHNL